MLAYVADCAAYELFRQQQPEAAGNPRAVAGFSVGEIAALVAAGIISYDQGLTIVKARAEAMQRWVDEEEMAALAVFGMEEDQLNHLCARVDPEGKPAQKVFISHCWGRKGFVCSGASAAVELLEVLVENEAQQEVVYKQRLEFRLDAGEILSKVSSSRSANLLEMSAAVSSQDILRLQQQWQLRWRKNPPQCEVYFNCGFRVAAGEDPSVFAPYLIQQLLMPLRADPQAFIHLSCGPSSSVEGQSLKDLMIFNSFTASPSQTIRPAELTTLGSASHAILLFPMPLTSSQASKILYNALQAAILFGFVGFVFTSILRPEAGRISSSKLTEEKHHCVSSKTWMILPFAFLTGGLINIDGFASTAVLLL
eukprot:g10449.t1